MICFSLILRSSHRSCSVKNVLLEISQSPQENTCVGVYCEICAKLFSYVICEICEQLKNISERLLVGVFFLVLGKYLNVRVLFGSAILETLNLTNSGGTVETSSLRQTRGQVFIHYFTLFAILYLMTFKNDKNIFRKLCFVFQLIKQDNWLVSYRSPPYTPAGKRGGCRKAWYQQATTSNKQEPIHQGLNGNWKR